MADVKALIAQRNADADRARGKAVGKRLSGLRLREEKVLLLLAELRRFEAELLSNAGRVTPDDYLGFGTLMAFSAKNLQEWRKVQPLLKSMELEMEGK